MAAPRAPTLFPSLPLPQSPADAEAAWENARALQRDGTTVAGPVVAVNRGGAVVMVAGLSAFIPSSKLDPARVPGGGAPPKTLVGETVRAKVVQVDAAARKLILSERAASLADLAACVAEGQVLTGVVTRLADYGAFVSLQSPDGGLHGAEGLIHLSELSWDAVLTPEAVVQPGTVVRVRVLGADPSRGRIELSLKRMEADPLTETLDALLPIRGGPPPAGSASGDASSSASARDAPDKVASLPAHVPAPVESVCAALAARAGVDALRLGRQVEEKRAVSQDLELWMSREVVADG